ncbi:hypothetical protein GL213_07190 [Halogeometricum borinquense]|uniref:Uncharacterized protein n=1 Tax=Halogeometricum borinquense TaxID=60847 RepID=A0A6C0UJF6_9EURY|nr:hypothetical protein [Halogeometricum borinquense]QIB74723.1 hypothetical protein G3I44_10770 [Halogeometricum borinquense]QIQ76322.1 hypothetical protein GL213_07190 [Halogeometricum borinquense]
MERPSEQLLSVFREFGGEALRDVWVFDERTFEKVFVRSDVEEAIEEGGLDVERFVDNERYGFITQQTYESLYYADYSYTVRGFSTFEQFRTFFGEGPIGVFASFDLDDGDCYDYQTLNESVQSFGGELGSEAFGLGENTEKTLADAESDTGESETETDAEEDAEETDSADDS